MMGGLGVRSLTMREDHEIQARIDEIRIELERGEVAFSRTPIGVPLVSDPGEVEVDACVGRTSRLCGEIVTLRAIEIVGVEARGAEVDLRLCLAYRVAAACGPGDHEAGGADDERGDEHLARSQ